MIFKIILENALKLRAPANFHGPRRCLTFSALRRASAQTEDYTKITETTSTATAMPATLVEDHVPVTRGPLPLIAHRDLANTYLTDFRFHPPRQAWMENFDAPQSIKLGLIPLHPMVWASTPRTDIIYDNIRWQNSYREVNWLHLKNRYEFGASSWRKPWPQKGTGRARHSCTRTPQWIGGGWHKGPRHATTKFTMLHHNARVYGLLSILSIKFAQNDLKIVDSLEYFPSESASYMEELLEKRGWGPSCLIVDVADFFPKNISLATSELNHVNLIPVYGLNIMTMVRHETIVLTLAAAEELERRMLFQLTRSDFSNYNLNHQNTCVTQIETVDYEEWPLN